MFQFVAGVVVIAASLVTAGFVLVVLTRSLRLRLAHGRHDCGFFPMGSGSVFGVLAAALLLGLALMYFSHR